MGIIISQCKDPYEPISIMECHKGPGRWLKWFGGGGGWALYGHDTSKSRNLS